MTLRTRVMLAAGFAMLLAVAAVSVVVYLVVRDNLHDQIYDSLTHLPLEGQGLPHDPPSGAPEHVRLVQDVFMQVVDRDGEIVTSFDNRTLPVTADVLAVARGDRSEVFFDADIDGTSVRQLQHHALLAGPAANWSPTPPTSCEHHWPPSGPTWRCSPVPTSSSPRTGRCSSRRPWPRSESSPGSSAT